MANQQMFRGHLHWGGRTRDLIISKILAMNPAAWQKKQVIQVKTALTCLNNIWEKLPSVVMFSQQETYIVIEPANFFCDLEKGLSAPWQKSSVRK